MSKIKKHTDVYKAPKRLELIKYIYTILRPKQGWILIISIGFFLFALFGAVSKISTYENFGFLGVLVVFIAIASLVFTLWNLSQHIYKNDQLVIDSDPRATKIVTEIKKAEPIPGDTIEMVIRDPKIDKWLHNQPKIKMLQNQQFHDSLRNKIRAKADHLEKLLRTNFRLSVEKKRQFSNDSKICLAEDILVGIEECHYFIGTYFDSYCTNEFCTKLLGTNDPISEPVAYGLNTFPAINRILKPIATSSMNNHIGISTLAITSDRFIQLWRQGEKTQVSRGKIVATGSGSLDDDDFASSTELLETVSNGMSRELREESSQQGYQFADDPVLETRVTGYFRWVKRGGKPEFVGVTRLRIPRSELYPNITEVNAPAYAGLEVYVGDSWDELHQNIDSLLKEYRHFSPSCWVALKCLQELTEYRPRDWEQLLFN